MTANSPKAIGIDLGASVIKYALVDPTGAISDYGETKTPTGRSGIMDSLGRIVRSLRDKVPCHIGVATPGVVDVKEGRVVSGAVNIPGWSGVELAAVLRTETGLEVFVDNDANAMAMAELRLGAAKNADSAICVTIGTGIGGALIIDGRLWRGASHSAGEIGQIALNVTDCGAGAEESALVTLESRTSAKALTREFHRQTTETLTPREIFERYQSRDTTAKALIRRSCELLGSALANQVNVLNPRKVILGGGVVDALPGVVNIIESVILARAVRSATAGLSVVPAGLGNKAGLTGAALLGFDVDNI